MTKYFHFLSVFILFSPLLGEAQIIDKIIARVDNQIVLQSELEIATLQFAAQQGEKAEMPPDLRCTILETLIMNKFLLAKADIDSVTVERSAVDAQLDRRMNYFIQAFGSKENLEKYYGKTVEDFKNELRKQVKEQLLVQKMQDKITEGIKITPGDVKKFFNSIPEDSLPLYSAEVEVGRILKGAIANQDQKSLARSKAADLRSQILKGGDFCQLAMNHSEDPGSKDKCGELGFFGKGELVPEFEAAALKLRPGETSEIVESQFGYHIIQLLARNGNTYNARHILVKINASSGDLSNTEKFLVGLRSDILSQKITFDKAAMDHSQDRFSAENGGLLSNPNTNETRIPLNLEEEAFTEIFRILDTLQPGTLSMPIPTVTEDGKEALQLIYYKRRIPPHKANLKDDYQKIAKAALEEKKANAINTWFDKNKKNIFINVDEQYKDCKILATP